MSRILHREKAIDFLKLVVSGNIREAYSKYVRPDFRHHNPYFRGDRESLMLAMEENDAKSPDKILEIKRTLEDNDQVMTFSHIRQKPGDVGGAVVHIFRFEDGLIAEMWDIGQEVPEDSPNENSMF